jgi:hypothetical protein
MRVPPQKSGLAMETPHRFLKAPPARFQRVLSFHAAAVKQQIILCTISDAENPTSFAGFIELSSRSE